MSFVTWKIEHTPFIDNGWSDSNKTTLSTYLQPSLNMSLGDGRDSFSFKVLNRDGGMDNFFNPNDKIEISRVVNSTTVGTDNLLMVGSVKGTPEDSSCSKKQLNIEGYNYSETVMNAIVFTDLNNQTINTGLQTALNSAAGKNDNFKVTWNSGNPTKLSDGVTNFPLITSDSRFFNKQLKQVIEKYSTSQKTTDGNYYWYVDNNNTLVWRQQDDVDVDDFNSETDSYKKLKIGKDLKGVRNYIILKGGTDPQGNQVQTKYVNYPSIAVNGVKPHLIVSKTNDAKNLVYKDLIDEYGEDNIGNKSYPSFPFTSTWVSASTQTTITASDEDEYVEAVRAHIKASLVEEGQRFAEFVQYGKLEVDTTFSAGTIGWGLGDNITCTIPNIRELPFVLRVNDIQYTTTTDTFTLTEDIGTIGQGEEA